MTNGPKPDSERITDLETRSAFQEHAFEELSEVVADQMRQIDKLEKKLEVLKDKVESPGSPAGDAPQNDPPPHY
jgi:SlyX protein